MEGDSEGQYGRGSSFGSRCMGTDNLQGQHLLERVARTEGLERPDDRLDADGVQGFGIPGPRGGMRSRTVAVIGWEKRVLAGMGDLNKKIKPITYPIKGN